VIISATSDVCLRAIEPSDLPTILKWRNSPVFSPFFREYRQLSSLQIESWYQTMMPDRNREMFVICDSSHGVVGVTGLTSLDFVNKHADLHFYIGHDGAWIDSNIAPKALPLILNFGFNSLNLNKIWAEVFEFDSLKLEFFAKFKFRVDGRLRSHVFSNGRYFDSILMSSLRSEQDV